MIECKTFLKQKEKRRDATMRNIRLFTFHDNFFVEKKNLQKNIPFQQHAKFPLTNEFHIANISTHFLANFSSSCSRRPFNVIAANTTKKRYIEHI